MGDFLEYPDILQEVRGALNPGRLKLQTDKVIFRNVKTGKIDTYNKGEIETVNWLIRARGYCIKFSLNNGTVHRYDGFKEMEYDKLASFVKKSYSTTLDKKDLSLKGWNWGTAEFNGNNLDFQVDGKTAFEVPLNNVSHSATSKNEVTLEFHQNDDAPVALTELRFFIPTDSNPETDSVEEFYKNVMAKADVIQAVGDAVAVFSEVQCLTPRGRYDVKIYPSFLQLHGKTFDYKIPYTTILRLFLLPHRDGRQMFFVISLDPPIKQGQTRYHFLIALFSKDVESTIELGLSDDAIAEKYGSKLQKEMSGLEYEIVSRIMKTLVNKKITVPGNFVGHTGTQSVQCSYKAATGFLYPLERGFIFVHKPPMHIRFDEVTTVNFARSSGSTRSFDFEVETSNGTVYTFVGMEKDEYGKLYDFVTQKKLRVKNVGGKLGGGSKVSYGSDEGSDDGHDAYLERMKKEGRERDDEDEDESTDEDYVAPESGSEVAEEFDTDAESSSSDEEGGEVGPDGEKKKKKKKEKKTITIREPGMSKPRRPKGEGGKGEKKGRKKDKNAPKRPMTAFFLWLNDNREKIKTDNPGIAFTDIGKKGGEMWKEVTAEDKAKYDAMHKKAKEKYDEDLKEYQQKLKDNPPPSPEASKTKSPKKKSPKKAAPTDTKSGSGGHFKSKEYISDSDSGSESSDDDEDKPLKKLKEKKEEKSKRRDKKRSTSEGDDTPKKKKSKEGEDEFEGLPSDEEILSSPEASGSESGGGSESGSD